MFIPISSSVFKVALVRYRATYRLGFILVCAAVWTCSTALTAKMVPRFTRTVRVYETAGLTSTLEQRALAEAEIVLRSAFVDVRWRLCTGQAGGVFANVYFNCVEWLAISAGTDVAVLLGRVAAHELGHLMMPTPAHARRGLMRPNWTPYEVRRNRLADWEFTAEDVTAMRQPAAPY